MMDRYLRTFYGRDARSFSYARFPCEQLDLVLDCIRKSSSYGINEHIGMCQLDGKICVSRSSPAITYRQRNSTQYCCLRRKNGENCWNVSLLKSHIGDFDKDTMTNFFQFLRENGVDLHTPNADLEYIQPMTDELVEKWTTEDTSGWCRIDNMTIREAEEMEKGWYEEIKSKETEGTPHLPHRHR